jgi:hypothetical protein
MIKRRKEMNRTELKRKTPLARGTSWLARTPFRSKAKAGSVETSSGPVKPRRRTGPVTTGEKLARALVKIRSGGLCELCGAPATEYQHRKAKAHCSKAELWAPANGLAVCGHGNIWGCHGLIHQNPTWAKSHGYTVASCLDPHEVPVRKDGLLVWFFDDGSTEPLDLTEVAKWVAA